MEESTTNSAKSNKELLKLAKASRKSIRTATTNKLNQIDALLSAPGTPVEKLEDAMDALIQKEDDLTQVDSRVEALIEDDAEMEKETSDAIVYKEKIGDRKSALARGIRKATPATSGASSGISTPNNAGTPTNVGLVSFQPEVRLPQLTIPTFDGDHEKWNNFWGRFSATVDSNQRLTKVEKLFYLNSYLEGDAFQTVDGLAEIGPSYDEAVRLLKNRYSRSKFSVNYHMKKLSEIQPVDNSKDLKSLRQLLDTCEISLRSLEVLGFNIKDKATFVCPSILESLPEDIRTDFCIKYKPSGNSFEWDAKELIDFIRDQIESREMAAILSKGPKKSTSKFEEEIKPRKIHSDREIRDKNRFTATAKVFGTKVNNRTDKGFCIFCKTEEHRSLDCRNYTLERKLEIIQEANRCFNCFRYGHRTRDCRSRYNKCKGCSKKHNYALCENNEANEKPRETRSDSTNIKETIQINSSTAKLNSEEKVVLLQTAVGVMKNPSRQQKGEKVRCFMDGGSEATFIREELSRNLKLPIVGEQNLEIYSCGNERPQETKAKLVKLRLENRNNSLEYSEIIAIELPFICYESISSSNSLKEIEGLMKSKGLQLAEDTGCAKDARSECDLLIGADNYWEIVGEQFERISPLLMAQKTKLGWTIQGSTKATAGQSHGSIKGKTVKTMLMKLGQKRVNETLEKFWNLESLGVNEKDNLDNSDDQILSNFIDEIKFEEDRYSVKFPWVASKETLPDNKTVAVKRMQGLVRKFEEKPKFYADYKAVINEQLKGGIIEEVPSENLMITTPGTYYLPHQGVIREHVETTKLRVVFDASSHAYNVPSLNDCLAQGPNLYPDLLLLLLRFRGHKVAMVADIEKAFHQIKIDESERDSTRFLWVQEIEGKISQSEFKTMRMTRVPFGVKSSPFLLAGTIKHHLQVCQKIDARVKKRLDQDLYVDDWVTGADQVENAYEISVGAARVVNAAGMHFRKWGSNSKELIELWTDSEEDKLFEGVIVQKETKILGMKWESSRDLVAIDLTNLTAREEAKITKRHILSFISRVFDPMGLISPFVVRGKMLFQSLWLQRDSIGWDTETPRAINHEFESWCSEIPILSAIKVPRYYFEEADSKITSMGLHCFCDSSLKAFSAVIYIRYETINGKIGTALVAAKTRIAPVKSQGSQEQTIPRLELMGCLIGARLTNYVKEIFENKLDAINYWTDSTIALGWVSSVAMSWKPFVSNRVQEIQQLTEKCQWGHCPGIENPADLPTRGMKAEELVNSLLWWKGPEWLGKAEINWPKVTPKTNLELVEHERRKLILGVKTKEKSGIQYVMDLSRHNSLNKSLRITAYLFRFLRRSKDKRVGPITAEEIMHAELTWVRHLQEEEYGAEIEALKNGEAIKHTSKIVSLSPILHEGVICAGGRIENSEFSFEAKHPIILSKSQLLSKLLVIRSHEQVMHSGVNDTTTQIRERYWIPSVRQLAKKLIKDCNICRRTIVKQADRPTAPLPADRITESPPFSIMGIDFAGPLFIKSEINMKKVYICLATCAVTRAIHLELVPSLNTDEFIMALRRIISRRGLPSVIYTDNAQTFKRADKDLKEIWGNLKEKDLVEFFGDQGIRWKFIVERAAWYGGWWERLVRSTKVALRKTLGQATLRYTELETVLLEVEALINSRPITYVYNNISEPTPLTPADFLIGQRINSLPPLKLKSVSVPKTRCELTKRLKYRENLLDKTWKRWRQDYIMELRSAYHSKVAKNEIEMKIDDVVLIQEDKLPRHMWKIGVICDVISGRDGKTRMCAIKTKNGNVIRRSVQHLCNLEIV